MKKSIASTLTSVPVLQVLLVVLLIGIIHCVIQNDNESLFLLIATIFTTYMFSNNMIIVLSFSLVFVYLLKGLKLMRHGVSAEGFTTKRNMDYHLLVTWIKSKLNDSSFSSYVNYDTPLIPLMEEEGKSLKDFVDLIKNINIESIDSMSETKKKEMREHLKQFYQYLTKIKGVDENDEVYMKNEEEIKFVRSYIIKPLDNHLQRTRQKYEQKFIDTIISKKDNDSKSSSSDNTMV